MDLIAALSEAAQRGVDVTIFTNDREPPPTKLKWRFWETSCAGYGEFKGAGYVVTVMDCDGDASQWWIKRRGELIAEGESVHDGGDFYHFDAALLDAEMVLSSLARAQRSRLQRKGIYARSKWANCK